MLWTLIFHLYLQKRNNSLAEQSSQLPTLEELKALVKGNKRAEIVIEHIYQNGFITTEDLKDIYHYNDTYRPTQDVRDVGIPLDSFKVKNKQDRWIAAYKFGDLTNLDSIRKGGRKAFPKSFKTKLIAHYGNVCLICLNEFDQRVLQIV